jgi:hypothetical protein
MSNIHIMLCGSNDQILKDSRGNESCELIYEKEYPKGAYYIIESKSKYLKVDLDEYIHPSILYIPDGRMVYKIPEGEKLRAYHPNAFKGTYHHVHILTASKEELKTRRNLALNGYDIRNAKGYYPHSDANVMTRDEAVFESRNAIDGYVDNQGHGSFPFQSWGGGLRDDLEFELYFGRTVLIDEIIITLRADYEGDHDIHWESAVIEFSDSDRIPIKMVKTTEPQAFRFKAKEVEWIKLNHLQRELSSAFSALSQIQVMGKDLL